jgi:hypothetical protein
VKVVWGLAVAAVAYLALRRLEALVRDLAANRSKRLVDEPERSRS